jgi:hypothetical protein
MPRSMSSPKTYYRRHQQSHINTEVRWVTATLCDGKGKGFIQNYLAEYDNIRSSFDKTTTDGTPKPGAYFINFIDTCKNCLLSNREYYHYGQESMQCRQLTTPGPMLVYSLLLKHIVHNAEKYTKSDARKIHELLFWFEQESITFLMVIPVDRRAKDTFTKYGVGPDYTEQEDGTIGFCGRNGTPITTGGMEISNTRVKLLLNVIHKLGDDGLSQTSKGGRKRYTRTRRIRRRRTNRRRRH